MKVFVFDPDKDEISHKVFIHRSYLSFLNDMNSEYGNFWHADYWALLGYVLDYYGDDHVSAISVIARSKRIMP